MRIALDVATALSVFTAVGLMGEVNGLPLRPWTRFAAGFLMLMLSLYIGNPAHYQTWHEIAQVSISFILLALGVVQTFNGLTQGGVEVWNWAYGQMEKQPDKHLAALFAALSTPLSKTDKGTLMDMLFGVPFLLCLILETLSPQSLHGIAPSLSWISTLLLLAWTVSGYLRRRRLAVAKQRPSAALYDDDVSR
jgi:hypothetical protein